MCLLVVLHRVHPKRPLVVAANRDEFLARPADVMTVLQERDPRIIGGRDLQAGGTWLAINEHGVVAGLTNVPPKDGKPDKTKRSRGELPLFLARHARARAAAAAFAREFHPRDFNPSWLLVADEHDAFYVDMTHRDQDAPQIVELSTGIHVLENRALGDFSPKADMVRAAVAPALQLDGGALRDKL